MAFEGFSESSFTHDDKTRTIWRRGTGPGVVVMHDMPGPTPSLERFAARVADAGFTVVVPHLFGVPGKPLGVGYAVGELTKACVSKEFRVLAAHEASPITEWLRSLCRDVHASTGGKGVGAIGMCITGNFALALMVDECLMAPVLSQPSLPFGLGKDRRRGLHVSDEQLVRIKQRAKGGVKVVGMRFTGDPLCPGERFARLREELGDAFEAIEIDSSPGNAWKIKRTAHAVVTHDLVDVEGHPTRAALERVIAFFHERLS